MKRIVVVLGVAAIIAGLVAGPVAAQAQTETIEGKFPANYEIVTCAGELVHIEGTLHLVLHITEDAAGGYRIFVHNNTHATGVSASGTEYVVNQLGNRIEKFSVDSADTFTLAQPNTFIAKAESTPEDDIIFHQVFHITRNANGELTAVVENVKVECK
jgi:hypothetical protein